MQKNKPTVVCVHGMGGSDREFASTCKMLEARGYCARAVCLPGHGTRRREELSDVSMYDYIDEVRRFVEMVEGPVILIGQSMGGLIVQKLLEHFTARKVNQAVLLMAGPPRGIIPIRWAVLRRMGRYLPAILSGGPFQPINEHLEYLWLNKVRDPARRREILAAFGPESGWAARQALFGIPVDERKVKAKILVVAGKFDRTLPLAVERKVANKYEADFLQVPHGHAALHEEGWEKTFTEQILPWIEN